MLSRLRRHKSVLSLVALVSLAAATSRSVSAENTPIHAPLTGKELQSTVFQNVLDQLGGTFCQPAENEPRLKVRYRTQNEQGAFVMQDGQAGPCVLPMNSVYLQWLLLGVREAAGYKHESVLPPDGPFFAPPSSTLTRKSFEEVFGQKLLTTTLASDARGERVYLYNPAGLDAAFKALYVRPSESRAGTVLGKLYNITFKDPVRLTAKWVAGALANKELFGRISEDFAEQVVTNPQYDAYALIFAGAEALYGPADTSDNSNDYTRSEVLSLMLRRQLDGTLPVLVNMLRTTLRDYDPEAFRMYGSNLVAPTPPTVNWPPPRVALKGDALKDALLMAIADSIHDECTAEGAGAGSTKRVSLPFHEWRDFDHKWTVSKWSISACRPYDMFAIPRWLLRGVYAASPYSPGYERNSPNAGTAYFYPLDPQVLEAFQSVTGVPMISQTKVSHGDAWIFYNPAAVETVFKAAYVKPSESRLGIVLQKTYDIVLRGYVRGVAETFSKVYSHRSAFEAQAKAFQNEAEANPDFWSQGAALAASYKLNGATCDETTGECEGEPLLDGTTMGTLLRRQIDGTLPVMSKALKTVLQDYDKDAFKQYGASL